MKKIKFIILIIALVAAFAIAFTGCNLDTPKGYEPVAESGSSDKGASSDAESGNGGSSADTNVGGSVEPEVLDFDGAAERYAEAIKPIRDVALQILDDLIESGDVTLPDAEIYNPRVYAIRYFYGTSFSIHFRHEVFVSEGVKSGIITSEYMIDLENFGEHYNDDYNQFAKLLRLMKVKADFKDAEINAKAEECAKALWKNYQAYKPHREIKIGNHGKYILLKADSELFAENYQKIKTTLNAYLSSQVCKPYQEGPVTAHNFPLIENEDIKIYAVSKIVQITVVNTCFKYTFDLDFNADDEFSSDWLLSFLGTRHIGYTPANPNDLNRPDEDYIEYFSEMKIEEMDFTKCYFYSLSGEDTWLNF